MVPSLPVLSCESSVTVKKTVIEKRNYFVSLFVTTSNKTLECILSHFLLFNHDEGRFLSKF